jgi:hypothetical protein
MFTVDEIRNQVIEALKADGIEAEARDVFKNGVMLHGVMAKGETVSPTIYVDENTHVSKAVEALKKAIAEAPDFGGDVMTRLDVESVRLYATNGETDGVITRQLVGNIRYGVSIPVKGVSDGVVKVTENLLNILGVTADDLFDKARRNLHKGANVKSMSQVLSEMMGGIPVPDAPVGMFVAMTSDNINGGAILTDTELLESFRKEHGDFWIIPSSIHELIFVPCDRADGETLEPMIGEVNGTCVSPEERLSNNLFKFDENGLTVFEG